MEALVEEQITNNGGNETQESNLGNEENIVTEQQTQEVGTTQDVQEGQQSPVENSNNSEQNLQEENKPTYDEVVAKLNEYQVREEEEKVLKERLGLPDIDSQTYGYMNLDQQIVNKGKQEYLRLCNEYGVDANPQRIDASINELKKTDPEKAYEFQRKFEMLGNNVVGQRQAVQQQISQYEISKFADDYGQLLNASPALNNVMGQYVAQYGNEGYGMYGQLQSVMDIMIPVYREAFEAGKRFSLEDKAKKDTNPVKGGIATATGGSYQSGASFTREQIAKMSPDEFAKNEKLIKQLMIEGKIQ